DRRSVSRARACRAAGADCYRRQEPARVDGADRAGAQRSAASHRRARGLVEKRAHRSGFRAAAGEAARAGRRQQCPAPDPGVRIDWRARSIRRGEPCRARAVEDAGGGCAHRSERVPRGDRGRSARPGGGAFRSRGKLHGGRRQSAREKRSARGYGNRAGVPARPESAVEAGAMTSRTAVIGMLLVAGVAVTARPAVADERFALVVSGVSGGDKYAESYKKWVAQLDTTL